MKPSLGPGPSGIPQPYPETGSARIPATTKWSGDRALRPGRDARAGRTCRQGQHPPSEPPAESSLEAQLLKQVGAFLKHEAALSRAQRQYRPLLHPGQRRLNAAEAGRGGTCSHIDRYPPPHRPPKHPSTVYKNHPPDRSTSPAAAAAAASRPRSPECFSSRVRADPRSRASPAAVPPSASAPGATLFDLGDLQAGLGNRCPASRSIC